MQFTCANCDKTWEISPRAFGPTHDTRTRCPNCKTWLIVTKSGNDATTTVIDPAVAAAQLAFAKSVSSSKVEAVATDPPTTPVAVPTAPGATAAAATRPSGPVPVAASAATAQTNQPMFALSPNAPTAAQLNLPPRVRHESSAHHLTTGQRGAPGPNPRKSDVHKGMDMFALPDPVHRTGSAGHKRVEMQQMLQDFSMMFRLETTKSNRKQQIIVVALVLAVAGGLWWAATQKIAYDVQLDAAREAKRLTSHWILQSAEADEVSVLPPDAPPGVVTKPRVVRTSALARQLFYRVHTVRPK